MALSPGQAIPHPESASFREAVGVVFLQDFEVVDRPFDAVVTRCTGGIDSLLSRGLEPARAEGERLRSSMAPDGRPSVPEGEGVIRLGAARRHGDSQIFGFSWLERSALFGQLEADLELRPLGNSKTIVTLRGTYDVSLGWPESWDSLTLQYLAACTFRAFLSAVAAELGGVRTT